MTESRSGSTRTHLILVAAQICFGLLPVAGRLALARIPPEAIVQVRVMGGAFVFILIARATGLKLPERHQLGRLVACTLLGVVINQELFVGGLARSTATNASVLGTTIPIFTALAAIALGRERAKLTRFVGIGTALMGAAILVGVENVSTQSEHLTGNLMILGNSISYALFLVLVRPLSQTVPAFSLTASLFTLAIVFVTPLGAPALASAWPLGARDYAFLAFLIAVPTVGAYSLTQMALRSAESSLVASYVYLQPVVSTVTAMVVLGERPGVRTLMAAVLIFAGVFLSSRQTPD